MICRQITIVRGLPGSGKSTFARTLSGFVHLEADMYFVDSDGRYNYNPNELRRAHRWCQETARALVNSGQKVVVSNTFTRLWEMEPYFDMADLVSVVRMTGEYDNIHSVPKDVIDRMRDRFEDYDGEIFK